jgi:ankyrin repeat protein
MTALTLATSKGNEQMVRLLLQYGGNPDASDGTGSSARLLAKKKGIKELISKWDDFGAAAFEVPSCPLVCLTPAIPLSCTLSLPADTRFRLA